MPAATARQRALRHHLPLELVADGATAGAIAGISSGLFLMLVAPFFWSQSVFTPLYAIASPIVGPGPLIASTQLALYTRWDVAAIGACLHLLWAALGGVAYGAAALRSPRVARHPIRGGIELALALTIVSTLLASLFGATSLASVLGWPLLALGAAMYGFVLGHWPAARPRDFARR